MLCPQCCVRFTLWRWKQYHNFFSKVLYRSEKIQYHKLLLRNHKLTEETLSPTCKHTAAQKHITNREDTQKHREQKQIFKKGEAITETPRYTSNITAVSYNTSVMFWGNKQHKFKPPAYVLTKWRIFASVFSSCCVLGSLPPVAGSNPIEKQLINLHMLHNCTCNSLWLPSSREHRSLLQVSFFIPHKCSVMYTLSPVPRLLIATFGTCNYHNYICSRFITALFSDSWHQTAYF